MKNDSKGVHVLWGVQPLLGQVDSIIKVSTNVLKKIWGIFHPLLFFVLLMWLGCILLFRMGKFWKH